MRLPGKLLAAALAENRKLTSLDLRNTTFHSETNWSMGSSPGKDGKASEFFADVSATTALGGVWDVKGCLVCF